MAQAKYGTGSVYQMKDGRYKWQGYYVDDTGKKHRPSKIFNNEQEALIFQAHQLQKNEVKKAMKKKDTLTFNDIFLLMKKEIREGQITYSETTRKNSIQNIEKHGIPIIGTNNIKNISILNLKRYFNRLKEQGLSEKTIYNIYTDIKKVIKFAVDKGYIYENPFDEFVIKQPKPNKKPVNVMSFKDYELIVNNEQNKKSYYYNAIIFLAETGLRAEELAIKKSDYYKEDNQTPFILINKSIVRALNEDDKTTTLKLQNAVKNEISERKVPLNLFAQNAIENQLEYCKTHKIHSQFIFCSSTGSMIEKRNLLRALHSFCKNANVERKGLHSLRKLYINHTLKNGITPFDLAKITGHSMQTMFKYYHDIDDEIMQNIANASESRK